MVLQEKEKKGEGGPVPLTQKKGGKEELRSSSISHAMGERAPLYEKASRKAGRRRERKNE